MKKIRFFSSYCSDQQIYSNIMSSWANGDKIYKDLYISDPTEDYDYAVCFNVARPDKKIPINNTIGFSHEPRISLERHGLAEYSKFVGENFGEYYISNTEDLPKNFISDFTYVCPFEYGKSRDLIYPHDGKISMILSLSKFMPGHVLRHDLLNRILKTDMDIHFYANGLNKIYKDERVKEFDWSVFNIPYERYKAQIVIENIIDESWATEKLINCIIKGTIPIYYGSRKIASRFYGNEISLLGNDIEEDIEKISIVYNNLIYDKNLAQKAKNILYSEINLLEFLHKKFNQ